MVAAVVDIMEAVLVQIVVDMLQVVVADLHIGEDIRMVPVTKLGNYGGANGWYPHPYFKGLGAYGMPQPAGGTHGVAGYGGGTKWTAPYTNDGYPGRIIIYRSGSEP